MDPVTHTLIRSGVPNVINPFDKYALEAAVQLKEEHGGSVTAVTMGPAGAAEALRECYSLGADRMVLVTDRIFGGSDTYSTGYILSSAIRKLGDFDLIICGKQAIDGDTAQVGPQIAEQLGLPQITYVNKISCTDDTLRAVRELENRYEEHECSLPALVTVVKSINEPRLPNVLRKLQANRMQPETISSAKLSELDTGLIGLNGSPTKVHRTFSPSMVKNTVMIDGSNAAKAVGELTDALDRAHISLKEVNKHG